MDICTKNIRATREEILDFISTKPPLGCSDYAGDGHPADMSNCPPNDYIGDKHLDTCLAGLFDNSYLKYIEEHPDATINEVYEAVAKDVRKISDQGVSMWGDNWLIFAFVRHQSCLPTQNACDRTWS